MESLRNLSFPCQWTLLSHRARVTDEERGGEACLEGREPPSRPAALCLGPALPRRLPGGLGAVVATCPVPRGSQHFSECPDLSLTFHQPLSSVVKPQFMDDEIELLVNPMPGSGCTGFNYSAGE